MTTPVEAVDKARRCRGKRAGWRDWRRLGPAPAGADDDGSRGFTVRDAEGNLWSFGTYRGE